MNKRLIFGLMVAVLSLTGCADSVNTLQRGTLNNFAGEYHIIQYSGGKVVAEFMLHDIKVTQEQGTDGVFFIHKGTQYEINGEYNIRRLSEPFPGPDVVFVQGAVH